LRLPPEENHGIAVFQQQNRRQRLPHLYQIAKFEACPDHSHPARARHLKQRLRRRFAWPNLVIAAQLGLAQVNAPLPRCNHQRAEHRRLGSVTAVLRRRFQWLFDGGCIMQCRHGLSSRLPQVRA
jgi:hypothetical protein